MTLQKNFAKSSFPDQIQTYYYSRYDYTEACDKFAEAHLRVIAPAVPSLRGDGSP